MRKILISGAITAMLLLLSCGRRQGYQKMEGMIWNTLYHITYEGPESLTDSVMPVLQEVGNSLSVFDKTSIVSRLNAADSMKVDSHFIKVYDKSVEINKLSGGNFDPTVSPLVNAWGFGVGHVANSDTIAIDSLLQFVGIAKTMRKGDIILKNDPRIQFNFSAIAKGYGCDAVGEMFKRNGVSNYMVEIGGELTLSGKSPSGGEWRISVDAPVEDEGVRHESAEVIAVTDAGIATSGNYRNFRKEKGKTIAHTISPVTGRPFESEILSATVIAPTCMEADALATACMASTLAQAKQILENYNAEGMLIFADSIWTTSSFPVVR